MIRRRKPLCRRVRPRRVRRGHEGRAVCDALWSELVRRRVGGRCERLLDPPHEGSWCGKTAYVQAHHPVSRARLATRHDPANGIALCRGCHFWVHHHLPASQVVGWYADHGIDLPALEARAAVRGYRPDYAAIEVGLKALLNHSRQRS